MKKALLVFTFLIACNYCYSQEDRLKNAFYVEIVGNGGLYSLNYEYQSSNKTVARIGISLLPEAVVVPITFGKLIGKSKDLLELGAGITYLRYSSGGIDDGSVAFLGGVIGYRYEKPDSKFLFRIGFTPLINIYEEEDDEVQSFIPLGGISFGFRF